MELVQKYQKTAIVSGIFGFSLMVISELNVIDLDLFHQLSLFREFIHSGKFPYQDVFSFIQTKNPVVHHEWGLGALLYIILFYMHMDLPGLLLFRYILYLTIIYACYLFSKRNGVSFFTFAPLFLITMYLGFALPIIRAQTFTQLFLIASILCIHPSNDTKKYRVFILLPIFLIWLNIHAGFLIGVGFISFYIIENFIKDILINKSLLTTFLKNKHIFILLFLLFLIIFINPYGYNYFLYLFEAVRLDRSKLITEWKPLWDFSFLYISIYLINVALIIYAIAVAGIKKTPDILFISVLSWLTLCHYKYTTIYAITLLCYLPLYLKDTGLATSLNNLPKSFPKLYFFIWIALGIFGIIYSSNIKFWQARIPAPSSESVKERGLIYPVGASDYLLENKFSGNIVTPFESGSYISWKLFPSVKVSMDSRFEAAYSVESFEENNRFYSGDEGWQKILTIYPIQAVLVPLQSRLSKILNDKIEVILNNKRLDYTKTYMDDGFSIYVLNSLNFPFVDRRGANYYEKFH